MLVNSQAITDADLMTLRNNAELGMDYPPGEEKVLKSVKVFLDSGETVASVTPSTITDASDYAAKGSKFKDDRRTDEDVYAQLEFSKSGRDRMQVRACSPLNHKNTSIKKCRVAAVGDFPVAFELMIEKEGSLCDFPLQKEPVIPKPKVSLEQEEGCKIPH